MGKQQSSKIILPQTSAVLSKYPKNDSISQADVVPAEEIPLNEMLPDLDTGFAMQIDRIDSEHDHSYIHQDYVKAPLPELVVKTLKPIPKPHFTLNHALDIASKYRQRSPELKPFAKYIGPSEDELDRQVEYDMDEQDRQWLMSFNFNLRKLGDNECSFELFEFIMDQLEKQWFELVRDIPKAVQEEQHFPDDITCSVCDDGEAENSNAIVFCDGCNLAVHQDCYGVPFIPEGQWLCRKCMLSPEMPVTCALCPFEGGAYKQTSGNKWAHLICAIWIPECHISNTVFMEPIEGIEDIQKSRWKLICYICQKRHGAPIQCASKNCFVAFHVTCARRAKLCLKMRGHDVTDSAHFRAYCDRHSPKDYKERLEIDRNLHMAQKELSSIQTFSFQSSILAKERIKPKNRIDSRKQQEPKQISPVIPQIILTSILAHSVVKQFKRRIEVVTSISKYWSLKRESRRGAVLLKRLHLEPWTANATAIREDDKLKAQKYEVLSILRKDLEAVRSILHMVQKRETHKHLYLEFLASVFEYFSAPLTPVLRPVIEKCQGFDKNGFFAFPVKAEEVPDYHTFIKNPMDFSTMIAKIDNYKYTELENFEADINLICSNCMLYNKPETPFYKTAVRLQTYSDSLNIELRATLTKIGFVNNRWEENVYIQQIKSIFS